MNLLNISLKEQNIFAYIRKCCYISKILWKEIIDYNGCKLFGVDKRMH